MATAGGTLTIVFDSNITKVEIPATTNTATATTSGATFNADGNKYKFDDGFTGTATLKSGYVLDTAVLTYTDSGSAVKSSNGNISINTDGVTFDGIAMVDGIDQTLTLTSKQATSTTRKSVDLSTLSGWANVADGEHTLTIKAKASGYADSEASSGVTFTKGGGEVTNYTVTISTIDAPNSVTTADGTELKSGDSVPSGTVITINYGFWNTAGVGATLLINGSEVDYVSYGEPVDYTYTVTSDISIEVNYQ